MQQEVAISRNHNSQLATEELYNQITDKNPILVIFMASAVYDFDVLSKEIKLKFPRSEVVGVTTSGELTSKGFLKNHVVLTTMSCSKTKVKGVLLKDAKRFPILDKDLISKSASECGIRLNDQNSHKDAFAMTFINGLHNLEEKVLSLFYAVIKNDKFHVAGGSAGDDLKFENTYISLNGEVTSTGAVILFVKTAYQFEIKKENIYTSMNETITLTDVDIDNRRILKINNKNPQEVLANKLKVSKSDLKNHSLKHPLGRVIGNETYMCAIKGFNADGTVDTYINMFPNVKVEILESTNVVETLKNTCESITNRVKRPKFVLMFTCILRTLDLLGGDQVESMFQNYRQYFNTFCGYSCYGEQLDRFTLNQTLVMVVIGE